MPNVRIRIERGREAGVEAQQAEQKTEVKNVATQTFFAHQMIGNVKQIISYQASNVANFTGDYYKQDRVNRALDIIGDVTTVGLGLAAAGPIGAVAAAIGVGVKHILNLTSENREDELKERDRMMVMERSGNSTRNGSRGTEN